MVADGTLTPARALEVCDRAIEAYQGTASTEAEKAVAAMTVQAPMEIRDAITGLLNSFNFEQHSHCADCRISAMERQAIPNPWPRSVEYAIAEGMAEGELAREISLPPDMFEEMLKTMDQNWQNSGCEIGFWRVRLPYALPATVKDGNQSRSTTLNSELCTSRCPL